MRKRIHDFSGFLNEMNGYGEEPFFFSKDGDMSNYFFKIDDAGDTRGFVITVGKFSKYAQPSEPKTEYGVISITEMGESELDQAVLNDGEFESNEKLVSVDNKSLSKIMNTLANVVEHYLEANGKIHKFYDEVPEKIQSRMYRDGISTAVKDWPGNWNFQEVERNKLNLISK